MGASQFVGRVGGLAVALGVGVAVFSGAGVASADRSAPDDRGSAGTAAGSDSSQASAPTSGRTAAGRAASAAASTVVAQTNTSRLAAPAAAAEAAPEPLVEVVEAQVEPAVESLAEVVIEPSTGGSDPAPVAVEELEAVAYTGPGPVEEAVVEPKVIIDPVVEEPETATPGDVTDVVMYATGGPSDGADSDPSLPVDSSLADVVLASWIRRETTAASATSSPTAQATGSTALTLAPDTVYYDGVLQGNLNVTSASGCGDLGSTCKLVYSFVSSSDGGKLNLNNVPNGLPGGGPLIQGTNGSYTFLPYATWIDPANPTKTPTPTGTQDFTVRVSESTAFDQTITNIPLIGMFAAPIIQLMQETPFLGDLLAPLIGASITQAVSVNVGPLVPGSKQVAYTYFVDSFDGTPISMNYFPAANSSQISLTGLQATIMNGPGLGSPGETNPYGQFQAAGSVPGLGLMRGQGLPAPFDQAPLGFNVITWDPRGEFASGGVLQLDNPFFEGRDVSALIDFAVANTPLLNEGGTPDVAMMGGSYGGGIQMTTVDPRIKSIVPSIAWNSLNDSLYPTNVFKTAWANTLALALLQAGANVNPVINEGILYGNLFGFLTESQQAVLASSGPTALLTKLNIPTMYDQGIVDALFPLQQAVTNAQTQLEQNPFFAGDNADLVKLLWFCGGHGVCTTQTAAQQTKQATVMFLENMLWVNYYTKDYIKPALADYLQFVAPFSWWDQAGSAWIAADMPWTDAFQSTPITGGNLEGGRLNSFTSRSGPLTAMDAAGGVCQGVAAACEFPLNQVFATEAKNAVEAVIPIPESTDDQLPETFIVGAPLVSFSYSGVGNAKAVYAQIVDTATGQVLGNINTAIPVTLDGKAHDVVDFAIANIAYSGPLAGQGASSLKLQIVANSSLYQNNAVIWSVDISDLAVKLPTANTDEIGINPITLLLPPTLGDTSTVNTNVASLN